MSDWIVWPLGIFLWLVLGGVLFFWRELPGLRGEAGRVTLSFAVWTLWQKFPLSVLWLWANLFMFIGGLSVHFFWHWCPAGSLSGG